MLEDEESLFEQEFSEQDVLPFLLQAQDIISKLESRVVELEADLSTIHRKYEHDRNDWLVGLSQKDQYINHLSSKLDKSDFNSKETIVLLSELITDDETIQSTITLCLSYLRQTDILPIEQDLEEGELERRQAAVSHWKRTDIPDHSSTVPTHDPASCDTHLSDGLSSLSSSLSSLSHPIEPTFLINNDDEKNNFCINCKQLLTQLDQQIEQKAYLKRDLSSLASALSEEEEIRSTIEQDKEALEQDVSDITSSLFSLLNHILMDEVTDRDGIVQIHRETNGKLTNVLDAWDTRDNRLKEVKDLLVQLDSVVHQSANASCTLARRYSQPQQPVTVSRLASRMSHPLRFSLDQPQSLAKTNNTVRIDGFILSEFSDHVKAISETNPIPLTPYMKRVLLEDIEPCLFFPQSQGWWKSPWFKKKLMDAISNNKCEIQGWHDSLHGSSVFSNYTNTTNSSSSNTSPATSHCSSQQSIAPMAPKTKCACCNILRVCEYKMRLPVPASSTKLKKSVAQPQPWLPIDRFCRDRLVAVCGFYSFMSHLKLMMTTPILSMFKQMMQHRRKMSLARVGSIGLFMEEEEEIKSLKQRRRNRESLVLDHSGSGSDTASIVSLSDMQGLEGQIVIVH